MGYVIQTWLVLEFYPLSRVAFVQHIRRFYDSYLRDIIYYCRDCTRKPGRGAFWEKKNIQESNKWISQVGKTVVRWTWSHSGVAQAAHIVVVICSWAGRKRRGIVATTKSPCGIYSLATANVFDEMSKAATMGNLGHVNCLFNSYPRSSLARVSFWQLAPSPLPQPIWQSPAYYAPVPEFYLRLGVILGQSFG